MVLANDVYQVVPTPLCVQLAHCMVVVERVVDVGVGKESVDPCDDNNNQCVIYEFCNCVTYLSRGVLAIETN